MGVILIFGFKKFLEVFKGQNCQNDTADSMRNTMISL